ncbi:MAG: hypothetical protein QG620_724 [Patescibacteria group bacterium]|nr:hypothetical protein [Patescibacteria group bacterium]
MPSRKDLSSRLVEEVLDRVGSYLFGTMKFVKVLAKSSGHITYETPDRKLDRGRLSELYQILIARLEGDGCTVTLEEFEGDLEKGIESAIEGAYVKCGNNVIFVHLELSRKKLEISAWAR